MFRRFKTSTINSEGVESNYFKVINGYLIIACLILLLIFCFTTNDDCPVVTLELNPICNDCDSCTDDYLESGLYCISKTKKNNVECNNDLCFNHSNCIPTCNLGKCIGPKACCKGSCTVTDDCPNITSITGSILKICLDPIFSCAYYLSLTHTGDCLSLIADKDIRNCLDFQYSAGSDLNGTCQYNWKCAPFYVGTSEPTEVENITLTVYKT